MLDLSQESMALLNKLIYLSTGFPPGLENRGNREEKYGRGKSQGTFFWLKVRELFFRRTLISNQITWHKYIMIYIIVCVSDCVIYIYIYIYTFIHTYIWIDRWPHVVSLIFGSSKNIMPLDPSDLMVDKFTHIVRSYSMTCMVGQN